jgi:hypothetical protein
MPTGGLLYFPRRRSPVGAGEVTEVRTTPYPTPAQVEPGFFVSPPPEAGEGVRRNTSQAQDNRYPVRSLRGNKVILLLSAPAAMRSS